ncbi:CotG/ExsB N-terminal domain-containing protein [Neobacillus massiliamazoniensis]|uniref:Uncharacterized protein n=1 Tax=Neobacillus massiliamazoniensis TaxID=1499688 RepID=A0A0U1NSS4_9BACI|nr:hypothetical protein [Neobacillus massiliamazoniensis]CRK81005.1 hypothetical protein BN000_00899 [Neobacillus massiliamazoniensis]
MNGYSSLDIQEAVQTVEDLGLSEYLYKDPSCGPLTSRRRRSRRRSTRRSSRRYSRRSGRRSGRRLSKVLSGLRISGILSGLRF